MFKPLNDIECVEIPLKKGVYLTNSNLVDFYNERRLEVEKGETVYIFKNPNVKRSFKVMKIITKDNESTLDSVSKTVIPTFAEALKIAGIKENPIKVIQEAAKSLKSLIKKPSGSIHYDTRYNTYEVSLAFQEMLRFLIDQINGYGIKTTILQGVYLAFDENAEKYEIIDNRPTGCVEVSFESYAISLFWIKNGGDALELSLLYDEIRGELE